MISYAQNAEDVVLERAFADRKDGFYIDVGAADPNYHSVTRHFYEKGWRGINIDPLPAWHQMLEEARPEDVNLLLGISDEPGELRLEVGAEHPGGATFLSDMAREYRGQGLHMSTLTAKVATLAEVCSKYVAGREIEFLKIDAEGFELKVIKGADWERWRPRVVVVEATEPNVPVPNHQAWEPLLLEAGYIRALFDGLNRFYVRQEDQQLAQVLSAPANVFDEYVTVEAARTAEALAEARGKLEALQTKPGESIGEPAAISDFAFYGEGMQPSGFGIVVLPLRRVLRRLQRPWFFRQVEIFKELRRAIDVQEAQQEAQMAEIRRLVAESRGLVAELRTEVQQQEARAWDQTAIARRLAAIEDALPDSPAVAPDREAGTAEEAARY